VTCNLQYQHLLLGDRKVLAIRLLTLEAAKRCLQENPEWGEFVAWHPHDRLMWRQAISNLDLEAREQASSGNRDQNRVRLDNLLADLAGRYVPQPRHDSSYVDKAITYVHCFAHRIDCDDCVRRTGRADLRPCYGHPKNDQELVALGGDCIYPVRDAAQQALQLAQNLYKEATDRDTADIEAVFSTLPGKPDLLRGKRIAATSQLHWQDQEDTRRVIVEVTVNAQEFDDGGLNLLPYCLAHEFVCHAFQQTATAGPRKRDENDEYDALAEGWMDYLVTELLRRGPSPWSDPDAADEAQRIHSLRKDNSDPPPGIEPFPYAGRVRYGAQAAKSVFECFKRYGEPEDDRGEPWPDFIVLSCQLNAHPWSAVERNAALMKLPRRLGQTFSGSGAFQVRKTRSVDRKLVNALVEWRVTRGKQPWRDAIDKPLAELTK
jgi:hypothetical protein